MAIFGTAIVNRIYLFIYSLASALNVLKAVELFLKNSLIISKSEENNNVTLHEGGRF